LARIDLKGCSLEGGLSLGVPPAESTFPAARRSVSLAREASPSECSSESLEDEKREHAR
jgi:hypothetical protein